jgi:hypothetical protein
VDAYVASLQAVHSSLAAKGDALDVVERKVLEAQVRPPRLQTTEISVALIVMENTGHASLQIVSATLRMRYHRSPGRRRSFLLRNGQHCCVIMSFCL